MAALQNDKHESTVEPVESSQSTSLLEPIQTTRERRTYEAAKTALLVCVWICMGIYNGIVQPSVDALKTILNCNYEELGRVLVCKSIGIMIGSVILGFLADKFKRRVDILLCLETFFMSAGITLVPWGYNLYTAGAAFFVAGFAQGGISAAGNSHCMRMWGTKASVPLHMIHFGFGLGSVIGPLLILPYAGSLTQPDLNSSLPVNKPINLDAVTSLWAATGYEQLSRPFEVFAGNLTNSTSTIIRIPFAYAGGMGILVAAVFVVFIFVPWPERLSRQVNERTSGDNQNQPNSTLRHFSLRACFPEGSVIYGIFMLLLLILFYVAMVGQAASLGTYLFAAAVDSDLHFSPEQGTLLMILFNGTYAAGRLVAIGVAVFLKVQILVFAEMLGMLAAHAVLCFYGLSSSLALWILAPTINFFAGPLYPSGMAWADKYVLMTALAVSLLDIAIGSGSLFGTWFAGYIVQYFQTVDVIYASMGWICICGCTLVVLQIIGSVHGERTRINILPSEEVPQDAPVHDTDEHVSDSQPLIQ